MNNMLKSVALQATDDVMTMYSQMLASQVVARMPAGEREVVASNLVVATLLRMNQIDASLPQ